MSTIPLKSLKQEELPLGQRLLKAGYRRIEEDEMLEILTEDKTVEEEQEERKEKFLKDNPEYVLTGSWYTAMVFKRPIGERLFGGVKYGDEMRIYQNKPRLSYTNLDRYINREIPDRCLKSVNKAKSLGAKRFYVVEVNWNKPDPIIVAKLEEDNYLYIDKWGPE